MQNKTRIFFYSASAAVAIAAILMTIISRTTPFRELGMSIVSDFDSNSALLFYKLLSTYQQELIEYRGFQSETHFIESADGYRLQTVRIINPHFQKRKQQQLKPVLLYHGYQCSGSMWIIATSGVLQANGTYFEENVHREDPGATGNTLGFVLAAAGYDVWLANSRGNIYSTNHSRLDPAEQEFWNFSADEIIKYDMPALIDYIRSTTKSPTVGYIGHSQGNLVMFGLLASQPKYNQLVKPFIGISPVGFFVEFNIPVIKHLETYRNYLPKLFPRNILSGATRWTGGSRWCTLPLVNEYICYLIYYGLMGSPKEQVDLVSRHFH